MRKSAVSIRPPRFHECDKILGLMKDLAEFEGYLDKFVVTKATLEQLLFKEKSIGILVAEVNDNLIGILVYYYLPFSYDLTNWIYIKELYISPDYRGMSIGKQLMIHLAKICTCKGGRKIRWDVLSSNQSARRFYESLGAIHEDNWKLYSLSNKSIEKLAMSGSEDIL